LPPRRLHHLTTATAATAALVGVLSGCGSSDPTRASDPTPTPVDELAAHDGEPCPARLPHQGDHGLGADDPATSAPELAAADEAWTCRYQPHDSVQDEEGTTWGWVREGAPRAVDPAGLDRLEPQLADLRPADADRICTMDLGPRWMLVLADGGDLTGVVVDDFGCRDVRLTDEPFETPPGEATAPRTVAGVLTGPDHLLPAIKGAHAGR
jgi:hypothetical protein